MENYFGNMAEELQNSPIMNRLGSGKSFLRADNPNTTEYLFFEEVLKLYRSGTHLEWIVLHDEDGKEVLRFRNNSLYFVTVVENGSTTDTRKTEFILPINQFANGKWSIIADATYRKGDRVELTSSGLEDRGYFLAIQAL